MAAGDITKKMIMEVREGLDDLSKKKIRADKAIAKMLNRKQRMAMTVYKCSRVEREYDLVQNKQEYEIEEDVLQIVGIRFIPETVYTEVRLPKVTNEDTRVIQLSDSSGFEAGDVMVLDVIITPLEDREMSSTQDPVIDKAYHDLLVDLVLADYRDRFEMPELPIKEEVIKELEITRDRKHGINRVRTSKPVGDRINY